jgi:RNA polymerase sigma factor (sigma-70 family)
VEQAAEGSTRDDDEQVLRRARAGDEDAFRGLTEPYRRELQVHCYRMLGSLTDAEDMMQETLLAAWRGLAGFQQRSSLRSWLYRIATNQCLNALRGAGRRRPAQPVPPFQPPEPSRRGEITWLQPYPDELLEGIPDIAPGPDARYQVTWLSMPPAPHRYHGIDPIRSMLRASFAYRGDRRMYLVPARANTQPALAGYLSDPAPRTRPAADPAGLFVLTMAGQRIRVITRFHLGELYPRFGLPRSLPEPGTSAPTGMSGCR